MLSALIPIADGQPARWPRSKRSCFLGRWRMYRTYVVHACDVLASFGAAHVFVVSNVNQAIQHFASADIDFAVLGP